MSLPIAEISLVSPLGLSAGEHAFFHQAEVSPHASGAFTSSDGEPLPIHDCPWIPASRPWASRVRLLAKQALARVKPASSKTPIVLVTSEEVARHAEIERFLSASGHPVLLRHTGSAAYVAALQEARERLEREAEIIVLAVDSLLRRELIEDWYERRYSAFTRNPLPPSEGAAALRLTREGRAPLAGKIHALAAGKSEATDQNDLQPDGVALTGVFAELRLPSAVPLVVGPRQVDPLRARDFHLAAVRHHASIDHAEMPSLEGKMGLLGSAAGLMDAVFALAWLRHGLPLPGAAGRRTALAWARSWDGRVGAVLLGDERS